VAIRDHGASIPELIFNYLPDDLSHIPGKVREIYIQETIRSRRGIDVGSIFANYMNIPNLERLLRYMLLVTVLFTGFRELWVEKLLETIRNNYNKIVGILEAPSYGVINDVSIELLESYYSKSGVKGDPQEVAGSITSFVHGLRRLTKAHGTNLARWISRFRNVRDFEGGLRMFYPTRASERRKRAMRTFIRWVSHETNLPIALRILLNRGYKEYMPIVDMYSASVTVKTGAFLALRNDASAKLLWKITRSKDKVELRIDEVKGIVRGVARLSGDPILYEKGAFHIGYNCRLGCNDCPLEDVCFVFPWVSIR